MLFILFLGGVEEGNEILFFFFFPFGEPNAVFFCYHSCSLGIKCN